MSAPTGVDAKHLVARGYDRIAERYLYWRTRGPRATITSYLDRMTEGLPAGARVLDLGCGAGKPYAALLAERFDVVGIDISREQVALARRLVPNAGFLRADMSALPLRRSTLDGIAALYSIIHLPREEHTALFARLHELLRPGRRLLAVLGSSAWEATESDWLVDDVTMYWSHYGADENLGLVKQAGFRVLASAIEPDPLGGQHLFIVAERPA